MYADKKNNPNREILIDIKKIFVRYNILITFKDNFYWMKVKWGIECWILENKKKIIVKLTILYKKTGESDSENSDDDKSFNKRYSFMYIINIKYIKYI